MEHSFRVLVAVTFYDIGEVVNDVSWIPNKHYSGVYGLLKLTLPKILPQTLDKILVLDTDVLLTHSVFDLWQYLTNFCGKEAFGLVENQSNWYLGKLWRGMVPWPALGRGFNTGVILMNLAVLRGFSWMLLWRRTAEKCLSKYYATALADQDIFNAVIKEYPEMLYRLPCVWNVQLGDNALPGLCSFKLDQLRAVHWNTPEKSTSNNRNAQFYRKFYESFLELDGNFLRRQVYVFSCQNVSFVAADGASFTVEQRPNMYDYIYDEQQQSWGENCEEFRKAAAISYRTHLFYLDFQYDEKPGDVSLILQLSADRLQQLELLAQHWEGPASVAVYLSDLESLQFQHYVLESSVLSRRKNLAYHIVYKESLFYPINFLRNIALENAVTPYVYLADVDFLPMFGLYEVLRQAIATQGDLQKKALVVPAFESERYRLEFPKSKTEVLSLLDAGLLFPFRLDWPKGHAATNFDAWKTATTPYVVSWTANFEPYIVLEKVVPLYDTRFVGFGWNKVSHIMELDAAGYDFIVLPNAFMIHLPHSPSLEMARYRSNSLYRRCLKLLKGEFMKDLSVTYNRKRLSFAVMENQRNLSSTGV